MALPAGRSRQKKRTRDAILDGARKLIGNAEPVTVAAAAAVHGISRATAYRYFSEPQALVVEAGLASLVPSYEEVVAGTADLRSRLLAIVRGMIRLSLDHEATFRTFLSHAVAAPAETRSRGGRRAGYLERALQDFPPPLNKAEQKELVASLCVLAGIEAVVALKDVAQVSQGEVEAVVIRMAETIIDRHLDLESGQGRIDLP